MATLVITGNDSNEFYKATVQSEAFDGGAGSDTISYAGASSGVTLAFGDTDVSGIGGGSYHPNSPAGGYSGIAAGDSYANIEHFIGSAYADRIYGADVAMTYSLGKGNDVFDNSFLLKASDTVYAGEGNDTVWVGNGDDLVYGGQGDDFVYGEGGQDTIYGGQGDDALYGGNGCSLLIGGDGNDYLAGGNGAETLSGGSGNDVIYSGNGSDRVQGGAGDDLILDRDDGDDTLFGNQGNDHIAGGNGNDMIYGGAGNDILFGDNGDDTVFGGLGDDTIWGGTTNEFYFGGAGADQFCMYVTSGDRVGLGVNTILDFSVDEGDRVVLVEGTAYHVNDLGVNLSIDIGTGGTVILNGVMDFLTDMISFV